MNAEKLSDALNYLDDDILEEAQAFRSRRKSKKTVWIRALAAVACLCIAFVGVHGVMNSELFIGPDRGAEFTSGSGDSDIKYSGEKVTLEGTSALPTTGALCLCYAEITEWGEDGFYAEVAHCEPDDSRLKEGTRVMVCFEDELTFTKNKNGTLQYYDLYIPDEADFEAGSLLRIELCRVEGCSDDNKAEYILWTACFDEVLSAQQD